MKEFTIFVVGDGIAANSNRELVITIQDWKHKKEGK
jgi:hypothetical protein